MGSDIRLYLVSGFLVTAHPTGLIWEMWDNNAYPVIGKIQIEQVTHVHVSEVLAPIWNTKPPTAKKVKQTLSLAILAVPAVQDGVSREPREALGVWPRKTALGPPWAATGATGGPRDPPCLDHEPAGSILT